MATRGQPFEPGNQMGRGRPKGSRNKVSQEARQLLQTHTPALMRKAIVLAMNGDTRVLCHLLTLAFGPNALPSKIGNLPMKTTKDLMTASERIARKAAAGQLPLAEAQGVSMLIQERGTLIERHEFAKRLEEFEQGRLRRDAPLDRAG
jgi:hypothetical protein